jgi:hypothetical protein
MPRRPIPPAAERPTAARQSSEHKPPISPQRCLYEILQISPAAKPEVIQAAYHVLERRYNTSSGLPNAARRLEEINAAYEVLSDAERRAQYDATRPAASTVTPPRRRTAIPARAGQRLQHSPIAATYGGRGSVLPYVLIALAMAAATVVLIAALIAAADIIW